MSDNNMDNFQQFIGYARYSRWRPELNRREHWHETVRRLTDWWMERAELTGKEAEELYDYTYNLKVFPSMRTLYTAGPALDRDHMSAFNCTAQSIDHPAAFSEMLYVLMVGAGAGFSVERDEINKLPVVAESFHPTETTIHVHDSRIGWCKGLKQLIAMLYEGEIPKYDLSALRPAGAVLKTFGGRSSGPEPLARLFDHCIEVWKQAAGRRLNSQEVHSVCCMIGEVVVCGGVRRSSLISLGNLSDDRHRRLKVGEWWHANPHFRMANNSAVFTDKPEFVAFQAEMQSLYDSKCGERGILNRQAVQKKAEEIGRDHEHKFLTNPCGEISLRNGQACNLSSVIIRPDDTLDSLKDKVRVATIYGTLQSSLTEFRFLRKKWQDNCEQEALLGVSLTGICDHPVMSGKKGEKVLIEWLTELRKHAREVNKKWAKRLGINPSAAITCIKPEGTSSLLNSTSSGIHPRYARYVKRTVRQANTDPLTAFLKDQGVPNEPCDMDPYGTTIFSFPLESPKESLTTDDVGTVDQLKLGAIYNNHWADHQVSMTVYYDDSSWYPMVDYMWTHWDQMTGVSFLPKFEGNTFSQAPLNAIDRETYLRLKKEQPVIDWSKLAEFEAGEDFTEAGNQSACEGDKCEIS